MKKKADSLVGREAALLVMRQKGPPATFSWYVEDLVVIETQTSANLTVGCAFFSEKDGEYYRRENNTPSSKICSRIKLSFEPTAIEQARKIVAQRKLLATEKLEAESRYREWLKEPGPTAAALIVSKIGSGNDRDTVRRLARLPQETLSQIIEVLDAPGNSSIPT